MAVRTCARRSRPGAESWALHSPAEAELGEPKMPPAPPCYSDAGSLQWPDNVAYSFQFMVSAPGRHLCPDLGERVMRMSSSLVAPSAVDIPSTVLLCSLTGAAMSQTTPGSALPCVTIEAPKQVATPQREERSQGSGRVVHRGRTSRSTQTATNAASSPEIAGFNLADGGRR